MSASVDDAAAEFLESVNAFDDSVLLVARTLGGHPGAVAATVVAVDPGGLDLEVVDPDGHHRRRVPFDEDVTDAAHLSGATFAVLRRARACVHPGDAEPTSGERFMAEVSAIRTYLTTVGAVVDVHPGLRCITFAGGDLATFAPLGPDTFLHLLVAPPGRPDLAVDRDFSWERWSEQAEGERAVGGYYTVRHWRPEVAEVELLFVLHGDDGAASAWASRAQPGDAVGLWGPRTAYDPPPATEHLLLVADETGLPAVARIVEDLPPTLTATVVAEAAGEAWHRLVPASPAVDVVWLDRAGAPPGTTTLLVDAVRSLSLPAATYAWGGAESRTVSAVRRYLRRDVGLEHAAVSMVGYWRHADSPEE